jgi:muramoyltetrapeptide carboxypeptidase LdcA involved in peptidoglycan recycling
LQGKGVVEGVLIGGCVETIDSLRGTCLWPSLNKWLGKILFLEISEPDTTPSKFATFLRCLGAIGILHKISGLLFGRIRNRESFELYDKVLIETFYHDLGLNNLPIVTRMDFGHTEPMMTIPIGMNARIDCEEKTFSIIESAVLDF